MAFLDDKGLAWFTELVKKYIGIVWSITGDTKDTLVLIDDDLDDYTTIGNYYCRPDTDAATVANNPAEASFILKVYSGAGYSVETSEGNYLTQRLENAKGSTWIRYKETGAWSDWVIIMAAGSNEVGSGTNPIYITGGVATASTSTVGSSTKPVYLNSGTITASSSTVGSETKPVYLNSGTITASSSTVGSETKPVYLNSGTITASSSTVGSSTRPIYLNSGTFTQCSYTTATSLRYSNCNCDSE